MGQWAVVLSIPKCELHPYGYSDTEEYFETEQDADDYCSECYNGHELGREAELINLGATFFVD